MSSHCCKTHERKTEDDDDDDVEVECSVCAQTEGEQIEAEKARKMQRLRDPRSPTQTEIENHNRTHLPHRNWCPYCVQGKGTNLDHVKAADEYKKFIRVSFRLLLLGRRVRIEADCIGGERKRLGDNDVDSGADEGDRRGGLQCTRCWSSWTSAAADAELL